MYEDKCYVVESYRPTYPQRGLHYRAHRLTSFTQDALHPCMMRMARVWALTATKAIAQFKRGIQKGLVP